MAAYSNLTDRTIWLTGVSSGIGKTLSQRLCAAGNKLIVSSRSSEALEQLSQEFPDQVQILTADLSKPGSEVELSSNLSALTEPPNPLPTIT